MTNNSRQFRLLLLILACTIGAACAQPQVAPLQYADDFSALGKIAAARLKLRPR